MTPVRSRQAVIEASRRRRRLYREAYRATALGLGLNLLLALVKVGAAWLSGSLALLADGLNSTGDVLASVTVLVALGVAQRPADLDHPYGHSRAESVAALIVSVVIVMAGIGLGLEALQRFSVTDLEPPIWVLVVAALNLLLKEGLYRYNARLAARLGSSALLATAWDHRTDALAAGTVLLGLVVARIGGPGWAWADVVAGFIVACLVVVTALRVLIRCARELLDLQAQPEIVEALREVARSVPAVVEIEKIRARKSGMEYIVEIHVEVDPAMTVLDSHRVAHDVVDALLARFALLRDVIVHIEPARGAP